MTTEHFKSYFPVASSINIVDGEITKHHSQSLFFIKVIKVEKKSEVAGIHLIIQELDHCRNLSLSLLNQKHSTFRKF
jgi:hypothetical protein